LARVGGAQGPRCPYRLVEVGGEELVGILEARPEGCERVAINPILSRHFPESDGYSAGFPTDEFIAVLKSRLCPGLGLTVVLQAGASCLLKK
jgi:hypothetical protein